MKKNEKISESLLLGSVLAAAGGFTDSYSYLVRGGVFANAETGNIVLMGMNLATGNYIHALHYLTPIIAFTLGILISECFRKNLGEKDGVHWKEAVLWLEVVTLSVAAFIPQAENSLVNSMIAFVCAMQVQAFRKLRGNVYATTMCTGNLRSGAELLFSKDYEGNKEKHKEGFLYLWIDAAFAGGAAMGAYMCRFFEEKAILICAFVLLCCAIAIKYKKKSFAI